MNLDTVTLALNDAFVLQQGQMLGNRSLGQVEAFPDMLDIALLVPQSATILSRIGCPELRISASLLNIMFLSKSWKSICRRF